MRSPLSSFQEAELAVEASRRKSERAVRGARAAAGSAPEVRLEHVARILAGCREATWLYVLVAVPIVFGAAQTRNFDLLKTLHFRGAMCVLVVLAVASFALGPWLARERDTDGLVAAWRRLSRLQAAVVAAALVLVACLAVSALLGIVPRISIAGSHLRNFGLFTEAANVVLLVAVVLSLVGAQQLERAFDAMLTSSLVVGGYGLVQSLNLDPLQSFAHRGAVIISTLGNPLFLGGFLGVTLMLTLARILSLPTSDATSAGRGFVIVAAALVTGAGFALLLVVGALHAGPWWFLPLVPVSAVVILGATGRLAPRWWGVRHEAFVYVMLGAVQVACLVETGARTSWIAAAIGGLVLVLAATDSRRLRLAAGALSVAVLFFVGLVLVSTMSGSPIAGIRTAPVLGPVISAAGQRFSVQGRVEIWRDVLTFVGSGGVGVIGSDPFVAIRPVIGHGAGTLYVTLDSFASPERMEIEGTRIDRAHNETLDRFAAGGALGLMAFLGFLAATVAACLSALRAGVRARRRWPAATVAAGFVAIVISDTFGPSDATSRVYFWFLAALLASRAIRPEAHRPAFDALSDAVRGRAGRTREIGWSAAAALAPLAVIGAAGLSPPTDDYTFHVLLASAGIASAVLWLGWRASESVPDVSRYRRSGRTRVVDLASAGGLVILATAMFFVNIRPAEADLYNRVSILGSIHGSPIDAAHFARKAIAISPSEELYYMSLGSAFGNIADVVPNKPSGLPTRDALEVATKGSTAEWSRFSKQDFFKLSEAAFLRARELNPFDQVHYQNLVRLADLRTARGDPAGESKALEYLRMGLARTPLHPWLNAEYGARTQR